MNLRDMRKGAGLTGAQVKAVTGISPGRLSDFERGRREPSVDQLVALLRVYGRGDTADGIERASQGHTLKKLRVKSNLTQDEVGSELEVFTNQPTMSRIERGQQRPTVGQLADMLDMYEQEAAATFLRDLLTPATGHSSRKTQAEKRATKDARNARRRGVDPLGNLGDGGDRRQLTTYERTQLEWEETQRTTDRERKAS